MTFEEEAATGVGLGEETDVPHGAPGEGHVEVGHGEGREAGALGVVEVVGGDALELEGEVAVGDGGALGGRADYGGEKLGGDLRIEERWVAEGTVGSP